MTRIVIRLEHKNLPRDRENILDHQLSEDEILNAVARFKEELSLISGDKTLIVSEAKSVKSRETIYMVSSALERADLIQAIEKTLRQLNIGGSILESITEVIAGP